MPLKDGGLVIKTPFRRREDVETNEDKEVAFVRTQSQGIEIIRFMDLKNGALVMEAIFNLKWGVEVKAVEGVNQNQNRSQRVRDEVGDGVAISRSNIKFQEIFRRAISFQMLKITLKMAFVRIQSQDIEIIRFMDLRNGALVMEAIFSLKWDEEVKAVEGVNQNQNRSQRVSGDEVGDGVAISRSNIKFQEIFRKAISFQMLKITLSSCQEN